MYLNFKIIENLFKISFRKLCYGAADLLLPSSKVLPLQFEYLEKLTYLVTQTVLLIFQFLLILAADQLVEILNGLERWRRVFAINKL